MVSIDEEALAQLGKRVRAGGAEKYHAANHARGENWLGLTTIL